MECVKLEESKSFKRLLSLKQNLLNLNLTKLLSDHDRSENLIKTWNGITLDLSRELLTDEALDLLLSLSKELKIKEKSKGLFNGEILNTSEKRSVLHTALRMERNSVLMLDGKDVVADVHKVLDRIKEYSEKVRSGQLRASDGEPFDSILCIGIGGSFLGTLFTSESFMSYQPARESSKNFKIRFLSNIDPAALRTVTSELDPNRTLVVITSKTFKTTETLKNAHSVRKWLQENIKNPDLLSNHLCGLSTNVELASEFGLKEETIFPFWNWVGGRFSVCSSVGLLPMAILFGWDLVQMFLEGCRSMDVHFRTAPEEKNLPILMGLTSFYNSTVLGFNTVALLPYSQDLSKFPQYVQQLTMESNGKSVSRTSERLNYETCEIYFGEPGTNGQHSFYQLLHQGRKVPCEFIGVMNTYNQDNELYNQVTHHVELMCNLFAQMDGLAFGKSFETFVKSGFDENMARFKEFKGNRPSLLLLLKELTPYSIGQLIALYEHRTAVQGFLWDVNSFDQMGVELGKELADKLRGLFQSNVENFLDHQSLGTLSYSSALLLQKFKENYKK